ncbi:hypothetical protein DFQ01_107129 [Paenibacillus cellulosilyticus]|uniref:Uncharacterized protein n=1 Tax=Paenibacillus cellulosilyticus TaxID=375489 RepID=A0A2V2YU10_9BACL|nr:hypothetical protein [Paenibacillus cellulosilyticus]PWW03232.1 hypothetical protein DFQ01_107129 [Paenibacillus cellulosilyticus]QKS43721.1 hypothetical protein HUB94_04175 [Paenibacillus cellulosilyticus]
MPAFDRFEFGMKDPQSEEPVPLCECAYDKCRNLIYQGELNWDYYGEWLCSTSCLTKYIGAEKHYAE